MNESIYRRTPFQHLPSSSKMELVNRLRLARVDLKKEALIRKTKKKGGDTTVGVKRRKSRISAKDQFIEQLDPEKRAWFASLSPKMQRKLMR